jgi:polysaccharide biosynthesis protein PelD
MNKKAVNILSPLTTVIKRSLAKRWFIAVSSLGEIKGAKWFEIIIGTLGAVWLGSVFNPSDPMFMQNGFPWIWIVPILLALRYGVASGLLSSILLILAWLVVGDNVSFDAFPKAYFIGGIITVMICGEYNEAWISKYRRLEQSTFYTVEKLEQLTHRHYILKLSHDRLEQMVMTKPGTLRDALLKLNELIGEQSANQNRHRLLAAEQFLSILSYYCQITKAAIFEADSKGKISTTPLSSIGNDFELDTKDPLVQFAIEEGKVAHVNLQELDEEMPSKYVVTVVLKDRAENILGLFVVESMPFFALHQDTLQMLSVLADYYVDSIDIMPKVEPIKQAYQDIPIEFAKEMTRLSYIERKSHVQSHIATLVFGDDTKDIMVQIKRMQRKMDISWEKKLDGKTALLTLMPLTDAKGLDGYAARISDWMKAHHGVTLEDSNVILYAANLGDYKNDSLTLQHLFDRCQHG